MLYYKLIFASVFLPLIIIVYNALKKEKRWLVLFGAGIVFYATFSVKYFLSFIPLWLLTYGAGLLIEKIQKTQKAKVKECEDRSEKKKIKEQYTRRSRLVLVAGIVTALAMLILMKYTGLFMPLGISFYTMQSIGYMTDVYWKKIAPEKNPIKLFTFLLFFLTVVEGPITAYANIKDTLFAGNPATPDSIVKGYTRLMWGCMKKLVIADRLSPVVAVLFADAGGGMGYKAVMAAVLFTIMEYMDFSGCMDMVCGIGSIFGINMPENFRQPFFAKNASEFWRRWHITLGVWFRTYIFYPVSTSQLAKKWVKFSKDKNINAHASRMVISALALFPVWMGNGFWHGPKSTYIAYGLFYFIMIMLELIFEPLGDRILESLKLEKESKGVTAFRMVRTWLVIFSGELIFQANNMGDAFSMFKSIFTNPGLNMASTQEILSWGMDAADWVVVAVALVVVFVVNIMREKGVTLTDALMNKPVYIRYTAIAALALVIMILGLYGPGHTEVDLIYANF